MWLKRELKCAWVMEAWLWHVPWVVQASCGAQGRSTCIFKRYNHHQPHTSHAHTSKLSSTLNWRPLATHEIFWRWEKNRTKGLRSWFPSQIEYQNKEGKRIRQSLGSSPLRKEYLVAEMFPRDISICRVSKKSTHLGILSKEHCAFT